MTVIKCTTFMMSRASCLVHAGNKCYEAKIEESESQQLPGVEPRTEIWLEPPAFYH